jgi:hypothetical protein
MSLVHQFGYCGGFPYSACAHPGAYWAGATDQEDNSTSVLPPPIAKTRRVSDQFSCCRCGQGNVLCVCEPLEVEKPAVPSIRRVTFCQSPDSAVTFSSARLPFSPVRGPSETQRKKRDSVFIGHSTTMSTDVALGEGMSLDETLLSLGATRVFCSPSTCLDEELDYAEIVARANLKTAAKSAAQLQQEQGQEADVGGYAGAGSLPRPYMPSNSRTMLSSDCHPASPALHSLITRSPSCVFDKPEDMAIEPLKL